MLLNLHSEICTLASILKGSPACADSDWSSSLSWIKVGGTLPRLGRGRSGRASRLIKFVGDGFCHGYRTLQGSVEHGIKIRKGK